MRFLINKISRKDKLKGKNCRDFLYLVASKFWPICLLKIPKWYYLLLWWGNRYSAFYHPIIQATREADNCNLIFPDSCLLNMEHLNAHLQNMSGNRVQLVRDWGAWQHTQLCQGSAQRASRQDISATSHLRLGDSALIPLGQGTVNGTTSHQRQQQDVHKERGHAWSKLPAQTLIPGLLWATGIHNLSSFLD